MVDQDDDLELEEDEGNKKKGGSKLKLIIIVSAVVIVLVGGSIGATLYFTGAFSGDDSEEVEEQKEEGEAKKSSRKNKRKGKAPSPAVYLALDPPFVVNFEDQRAVRFLQITVDVMARDQEVLDAVNTHGPAIRNNLIILFSSQDADAVGTREGKEKLRKDTLAEINKILAAEGADGGLEAVYFTSFVMQ